jgi:hypothetical protein
VWFDEKECGDSSYDLKPGSNVTSGEFIRDSSGRLMGFERCRPVDGLSASRHDCLRGHDKWS